MDATAVAAGCAFSATRLKVRDYLSVAFMFGGFQAIMPLAGWIMVSELGEVFKAWDHWIAFVLLSAIGAKMLWDAIRDSHRPNECKDTKPFRMSLLLPLAIATSIDALAAGVVLPMMGASMLTSVAIIGITTGVLSCGGMVLGKAFGSMVGKRFGAFGGTILIVLAFKILAEHLLLEGIC